MNLQSIKEKIRQNQYLYSQHAEIKVLKKKFGKINTFILNMLKSKEKPME